MRKILAVLVTVTLSTCGYAQIIDHNCTDLLAIPSVYINQAKASLHIAYEHTSHGSQIIDGMTGLYNWKGSFYLWNNGGLNGAIDINDHGITGGSDLGSPDWTTWASSTRTYLRNPLNSDVNVVMWAWCGQVSTATEININTYLSLMSSLENEFPGVKFVYMTGHLDGTGIYGNLNLRNEQIRNYCRANNKLLYDFADIESYDPDGSYYLNKRANDNCDYDSNGDGTSDRNWATDWQNSHILNVDWYNCSSAHSKPLNANMKAYAAWWLFARLAGWTGPSVTVPVQNISVSASGGVPAITSNRGTLQLNASVSPANATNKGIIWSVSNKTGHAAINTSGLLTALSNGIVDVIATAADGSGVYGTLSVTISNQVIPVTSIVVSGQGGSSAISADGGTLQLYAAVLPSDATKRSVIWSVEGLTGHASISSSGLVTSITDGIVLARASATDGTGITGTLQITITNQVIPVENITLVPESGSNIIPEINNTLQLTARVLPEVATVKTVNWSVENITGKAEISNTGLVTAIDEGIVSVTATATDGTGVNSTIEIDIKSMRGEPLSVIVNENGIQILLNGSYQGSRVNIYDINGILLSSNPADDKICLVDNFSLRPGIYIVTLSNSVVLRVGKFVVR